jgi:hypothetical protein
LDGAQGFVIFGEIFQGTKPLIVSKRQACSFLFFNISIMNTKTIAAYAAKANAIREHIEALKSFKYDQEFCPDDDKGELSMYDFTVYRQDMDKTDDYTHPTVRVPELEDWLKRTITRAAMVAELERQLEVMEQYIRAEITAK